MDDSQRRRIVEAVILASQEPISAQRVAAVIPYCKPAKVKKLVDALNSEYVKQGRSFEIEDVAGGFQVRTLPEYASYLQQIQPHRPLRLSKAALETLAIVAYKQPVTRAEIENVRGVDAGAVVRSLLERKLVRLDGHKEVPGRPMLYGTTRRFLEVFGLDSLEDLPSLRQLEELAPADDPTSEETVNLAVLDEVAAAPEASAAFEEAEPVGKLH
jgi:segregation and condensation protein B